MSGALRTLWDGVNGWDALRQPGARLPNLIPHTVTVQIDIAAGAGNESETSATGSASTDPESEFYVLAASVAGYNTTSPATAILGNVAADSPEGWSAYVTVRQERSSLQLSSARVRVGHMFGQAGLPYVWPAPWVIPPASDIAIDLQQRSNQPFRAYFQFHGWKRMLTDPPLPIGVFLNPRLCLLLAKYRPFQVVPFWQSLAWEPAAGRAPFQTEQRNFSVGDVPFVALDLMGSVEDPGAANLVSPPDAGAVVYLRSGGVRLSDRPVSFANMFGVARAPRQLCRPLECESGTNGGVILNFSTAGTSSSAALNAQIAFAGVRVFGTARRA